MITKTERWERELLRRAEDEFVAEFEWARPFALGSNPATSVASL